MMAAKYFFQNSKSNKASPRMSEDEVVADSTNEFIEDTPDHSPQVICTTSFSSYFKF